MASTAREQPRVLHFIRRWLPLSEPFVYDLVTKSRCSGPVVSSQPLENVDLFPYEPLLSLDGLKRRTPLGFRQKVVTAGLMYIAWRNSVGVVHAHHGYGVDEVVGTCRRLRLPMVLSLHGHDVTGRLENDGAVYERAIEVLDAVVVPSPSSPRRGRPGVPVRANSRDPVWGGHDSVHPDPAARDPSGGSVRRPLRRKEGFGRSACRLDVGPLRGPRCPVAHSRVRASGRSGSLGGDGVEVVIRPDHEQVREAIRRAYVVVSPSRTAPDDSVESLLVVNLEAQASGRPVVTTRHGGFPSSFSTARPRSWSRRTTPERSRPPSPGCCATPSSPAGWRAPVPDGSVSSTRSGAQNGSTPCTNHCCQPATPAGGSSEG